jgi:DNA-binding CsgD family transcriptional regulator
MIAPLEVLVGEMDERTLGASAHGRFLLRPYALAGHSWEPAFTALCCLLLGTVFLAEVATPATVMASLALIPVLTALWLLSRRSAAIVAAVAATFLLLSIVVEAENGWTLIVVGLVTLAAATVTRLYATSLVVMLSRSVGPGPVPYGLLTLDGMNRPTHGIRSLTRRELDVARLAAEGHTAAEIAARLHIGERTVESHLASTYSKLGINSKSKLIRMASTLPGDISNPVHR